MKLRRYQPAINHRTVASICRKIDEHGLDRVVLAGYRGLSLTKGLQSQCHAVSSGACLVFTANIGEQCANVHAGDRAWATAKAVALLRGSLTKARYALPRALGRKALNTGVLVVGGGVAGLSAALSLADQGLAVTLVEKTERLGGNALDAHYTLKGSEVAPLIDRLVTRTDGHEQINVLRRAELTSLKGTWGRFESVIGTPGPEPRTREDGEASGAGAPPCGVTVEHGAVVFATGGREAQPEEYLYGQNDHVVTQRQFERMLAQGERDTPACVVMIQCVGSRDENRPYCSRVCCTQAVKNALKLKDIKPEAQVYVLYRDMRTYGFYETYYQAARDKGVVFVRYAPEAKPTVSSRNGALDVRFLDELVGEMITVDADLLVLSTGIATNVDNAALAQAAGLDLNADGFFAEANPKSAPLDAVDRGKYICGLGHSPQHIGEAICQGRAAGARAAALLWAGEADYAANLAYVTERLCSGCGLCVEACPYDAREIDAMSKTARVLEDLCKGCGACAVSCPNSASQQYDFERATVMDVLDDVLAF